MSDEAPLSMPISKFKPRGENVLSDFVTQAKKHLVKNNLDYFKRKSFSLKELIQLRAIASKILHDSKHHYQDYTCFNYLDNEITRLALEEAYRLTQEILASLFLYNGGIVSSMHNYQIHLCYTETIIKAMINFTSMLISRVNNMHERVKSLDNKSSDEKSIADIKNIYKKIKALLTDEIKAIDQIIIPEEDKILKTIEAEIDSVKKTREKCIVYHKEQRAKEIVKHQENMQALIENIKQAEAERKLEELHLKEIKESTGEQATKTAAEQKLELLRQNEDHLKEVLKDLIKQEDEGFLEDSLEFHDREINHLESAPKIDESLSSRFFSTSYRERMSQLLSKLEKNEHVAVFS